EITQSLAARGRDVHWWVQTEYRLVGAERLAPPPELGQRNGMVGMKEWLPGVLLDRAGGQALGVCGVATRVFGLARLVQASDHRGTRRPNEAGEHQNDQRPAAHRMRPTTRRLSGD